MVKKFLFVLMGILFIISFIGGGLVAAAEKGKASEAKPIVIGWLLSLSGPMAAMGKDAYEPVNPMVELINKEGGFAGHPIKMIVVDTESDPTKAVIAAKRLITQEKVHILLGDSFTGISIPVGFTAAKLKTPHLAHAGSEMFEIKLKEAGKDVYHWNFRLIGSTNEEIVTPICKKVKSLGTQVGVLYTDSAYGKSMSGAFKAYAKNYGLDIVFESSYPMDATVFGPQINSIKSRPDLQVITVHGAEYASALCIAALREAGITLPIVTHLQIATREILQIEKIRNAYEMKPVLFMQAFAPDCWETLPKDDPRRVRIEKWNELNKKLLGRKLTITLEAYTYGTMDFLRDVWERILKDDPTILDKDLSAIRLKARDYVETVKNIILSCGVVSMGPEDHLGVIKGTSTVMTQYKYPPPHTYLPGFEITKPPWSK